ncbi:MAG: MarC family protein [Lentisphaerae bacterium]|jgi:multiple antibiotic resistance protein|nr:MarC family protein [Lentisphaerota bacterium]HQL10010.1 MarC family protein [Lentisphaeria bacterium]
MTMAAFFTTWLQFTVLLTPFFVLSMFLSMTIGWPESDRRRLAIRIGVASFAASIILFYFGNWIFHVFGITVDAFRIGGGALLFLTAVGLVQGDHQSSKPRPIESSDIAVVPLAIPITVGPGTTGALLVIGAQTTDVNLRLITTASLIAAIAGLTGILLLGSFLERVLRLRGITIISKLTGLFLSAMAAEMLFTGIRSFFK